MSLYAAVYDAVWRLEARLSGSRRVALQDTLLESERWSADHLRHVQWSKLQALLQHAYEQVPFYRRRFDELGAHPADIRTPEDFARIPPLTRAELQEHQAELTARDVPRDRLVENATGGSTGKPVHFHLDRAYGEWASAMMRVQDSWTGLRRGEPHAFLWGAAIDLGRQRVNLSAQAINRLKRSLYLDCFHMDGATLGRYARELAAFRPRLLTGYVLGLQVLARFILREGLPVPRVGAVQTGAEPLRDGHRSVIAEAFRAPVFERYGGRDIGAIAHECEAHRGMHVFAANYYVESVREGRAARPGELGELLITHLDNHGAPFIRYRSEDLGVLSDRRCPCGRTYPILEKVEGRILDLIVGVNGRVLPGEFFPHFFKDFDIGEYQVIQKRRDLLELNLVRGREFTGEDERRIRATIRGYLGEATQVQVQFVDTIPKTSSGKFRVTISELQSAWS